MFAALGRRRGKFEIAKDEAKNHLSSQNGQMKPPPVKKEPQPSMGRARAS